MAVDSKVSIFTNAMRSEFINAYETVADPAPFEKFTQIIPSDARIEHYAWMSPSPGMAQWRGHRRFGKINSIRYSVENKEFDSSFSVLLRDIEDEKVGGYKLKAAELSDRAKAFPGRWALKGVGTAGQTGTACFDGSNFYADSHNLGSGDNNLTFDGGGNDGVSHRLYAFHTGGRLKPILWQNRKPPKFMTDAGSDASSKRKQVDYWIDMEGEMAFGYWWDSVYVAITDTPTITEMHTIFANIENAFRGFTLPKALTSDDGEYPHEQTQFSSKNLCLVGTPKLGPILRQALNSEWVPVGTGVAAAGAMASVNSNNVGANNLFLGWADYMVSNLV